MKTKNLKKFIKTVGDQEAADLFGVTKRAAQSWRLGDREPKPEQARLIVRVTKGHKRGSISFDGIYGEEAVNGKV